MSNVVFELFAKLGLDSSDYEKGLGNAKDKASSVGGAIGNGLKTAAKVGVAAIGAATTAVGAFATSSLKVGADFDKSMSQVAATMGLTMDEMANQTGKVDLAWGTFSGNLREYAQEMGKNTAFSATEAADALNYMALAGYDVQTSMQMLPNVLNLAAAGNMDLARASDMVTDTQTAFGISLERTSQMVDEMAKAASTGNTSVEQLGDAFLTVGGLAQEMSGGMVTLSDGTTATYDNVQELEIALTAMANAGIKGSEAGTHMRNMLLKLASPTKDGVEAFKKLGVNVFDSEGKMRSIAGIMEDLDGAMSTLTQKEKLQAISDIFNTRDTAAAEALMSAVGQDWGAIAESILDADGAAQQMADTQLDNLAGDVTLFKSALEGAKIAVSDGLTPSLRDFVKFGTDGLSRITDAFQKGGQKGGVSGAVAEFKNILSDGIGMITKKIPDATKAGIELLGAIGRGLAENTDVILDAAVKTVDNIMKAMLNATEGGEDSFVLGFLEKLGNTFIENAPGLLSMGAQILENIITGIATSLPDIIPTAIEVILTLVTSLLDNVDLLIDSAIALITGLTEGLINALPILLEKAPIIIEQLVTAIINNAPKLLLASVEIITKLVVGILQSLPQLLTAAMDIITSIQTGIVRMLPQVFTMGRKIVDKIWQGIKSLDPIKWGQDMMDSFIQGIKNRIAKLGDAVKEVGKTIKDIIGFSEPKMGPLSNFHTFAPDMMELFAQGIRDSEHLITDQIEKSFDFGDTITSANISSSVATSPYQNDIINLLRQIATNQNVTVVLQGDADRLFRVIQSESARNKQITGQESFA